MWEYLKTFLVRPTKQDKASFFTFQSIRNVSEKTYVIDGCTKGFIALMVRNYYTTKINETTISVRGNHPSNVGITMNDLPKELLRLKTK